MFRKTVVFTGLLLGVLAGCSHRENRTIRLLIPQGYNGPVTVRMAAPGAPPLPSSECVPTLAVPATGYTTTGSVLPEDRRKYEFFEARPDGSVAPIPKERIWGEKVSVSRTPDGFVATGLMTFFIGSRDEYLRRANGGSDHQPPPTVRPRRRRRTWSA